MNNIHFNIEPCHCFCGSCCRCHLCCRCHRHCCYSLCLCRYCMPHISSPLSPPSPRSTDFISRKTVGWKLLSQKKTETRINGFLEIAICSARFTLCYDSSNSCIRKTFACFLPINTINLKFVTAKAWTLAWVYVTYVCIHSILYTLPFYIVRVYLSMYFRISI